MTIQGQSAPLLRDGLAVAVIVLALFPTKVLPLLSNGVIFVLPLGAIILSAWYGGRGPGLLTTLLSVLALDYFFIPPVNETKQRSAK